MKSVSQSASPSPSMAALAPFAEVLSPWTIDAERRLRSSVPDVDRVLDPSALTGLVGALLHELALVASPTLLDLFQRHPGRRWFSRSSTRDYVAFVDALAQGGLDRAFAALPALPRLLHLVVDDWCERARRVLERVERDRALLRDRFGFECPVARLDRLIGGSLALGDRSGTRVVYKDRPLGMDAALCTLLRWVNAGNPRLQLFVPEVINRGDFGWMLEVPHDPPREPTNRRRYLERTGMLVCLAHALGGGDLHAGNIRAFGEHPVILDAEVLLRPRRTGGVGGAASALTTGWLPTPTHLEVSGLACEYFARESDWLDVGSDAMRPRPRIPWRARLRLAVQEGLRRDAIEGVECICTGFSELYGRLVATRPPLDAFEAASPRVLLRPTRCYVEAITGSVQPEHLSSVRQQVRVIDETISDVPTALVDQPTVAKAVRTAERSAMGRLEIPRFSMPATGGQLSLGGRQLGSPFREAPLDRAHRFLSEMRASALDAHRRAIADSLWAVARAADAAPFT